MFKSRVLMLMLLATISSYLSASETIRQSEEAFVSSDDFAILAGDSWSGSLSYLDYSSKSEARIPVEIRFDEPGTRQVFYRIKYPGEAQYNAKEKLKWSRDGRSLNGETIVSRNQEPDGTTIIITEFDGKDDNRPAKIRMTYSFNATMLVISKHVRFEDEEEFFRRNAYELVR